VRGWAELSGENPALAQAELAAVIEEAGGSLIEPPGPTDLWVEAELPEPAEGVRWADALALGRAIWTLVSSTDPGELEVAMRREAAKPGSARFDRGDPAVPPQLVHEVARAFQAAGGTIRLDEPPRRYLLRVGGNRTVVLRRAAVVDRGQYERRRMPTLPFQRPVSLPPRRARVAANLAHAAPGRRVADPFLGTGALLLEAGLLGARLFGADRDPIMVRGAMANFAAFGIEPERLSVHDAARALDELPWPEVDAIVTDPPYGRASSSGGEAPRALLARVLPPWVERLAPGGRLVLVGPVGEAPELPGVVLEQAIPDRVHRSLTREFRVYRRPRGDPG
jgi:tRNA (guanine10-N2)-dimethyltransferase